MPAAHCTGCGAATADCPTAGRCTRDLEPPRYCPTCGRRMAVQVTPRRWTARCRDHGEVLSSTPL